MMSPFGSKKNRSLPVRVSTFDSELEFELEPRATGQELFDLVCRTIGLRESWYFGLQYVDTRNNVSWLKMDKKVKDQRVELQASNSIYVFSFYAKFFPENVSEELIQEITQHLFFLQVKQSILSMDIYCRPEASVLLASYAVHVQYGPYDYESYKDGMLAGGELLPKGVTDQYQMTPEMWEERIKTWYMDHEPMTRDEVEMEYLKIAQDLDMYGVNYFPITNKNKTKLWLGVTAVGLNIYDERDKLTPKTTFQWNEIRHVSFDDKKFTIRLVDAKVSNFIFYSQDLHINKMILDLCKGNHDLYMRRRKPDTMEIQQMKAQAKEEKQRRQIERKKFIREKKLREKAEHERYELEKRLDHLQDEMRMANDALRRSEETKELYFEKSRVNEEQMQLTECKANHFKTEMDRLRERQLKVEREKHDLEKKIRDADFYVLQLTVENDKREAETEKLKKELICAKMAEREATARLLNFLNSGRKSSTDSLLTASTVSQHANVNTVSSSIAAISTPSLTTSSSTNDMETAGGAELTTTASHYASALGDNSSGISDDFEPKEFILTDNEMEQITNEMERSHLEYLRKSKKQVQNQLQTLRSEIAPHKIEENQSNLDILSEAQIKAGENKYSTLKKLKSGSTKARVAFFEEL
ncbi:LOW QUALITY PROTEIN: moesin/ezrin/radixin homolog 2 [Drosophila sulfurigaster albostrigata]|uniref:Moesin/ezrin/radixin homolog 2 n=1 Tax=Drosophila albomicans TaxID=7291 RepID=A0A6P8WPF5_DROAB|nr:moesin/ezrin/radixin homolog 2 [Drosophila albomicans]XP_060662604.1 moesin/ezrin/radixin homolog 2 [Drosophila nasuta]XP_062140235.1 LOW QUALITY PROTEIN: moesin/ezrin/radixin homolog 2 [Drosophila sulfurigaster albostrigata]